MQSTQIQTAVQAVIFDLDGVLMNSEWLAFLVWREFVEQRGGRLEKSAFGKMAGLSAEETAVYVRQNAGIDLDVAESRDWIVREMTGRLKTELEPLPGAVELVRELRQRGLKLAIASNSVTQFVDDALSGLGLARYFPIRATIDHVANGKPAPDVYLRAARQVGALPETCLAIEDSRVGVQAAAAAGMRVIAVPGEHDHSADFPGAWRIYPSLVAVLKDLDGILAEESA